MAVRRGYSGRGDIDPAERRRVLEAHVHLGGQLKLVWASGQKSLIITEPFSLPVCTVRLTRPAGPHERGRWYSVRLRSEFDTFMGKPMAKYLIPAYPLRRADVLPAIRTNLDQWMRRFERGYFFDVPKAR